MGKIKRLTEIYGKKGWRHLLFKSAFALTITSGLSYFFGLLRDRVLTQTFGLSADLDVYNAAFVVPDLLLAILVTSALAAAFIPLYTELLDRDNAKAARYTSGVLNLAILVLLGAAVLFGATLPLYAHHLVPGFSGAQLEEYITMTRILLLGPVLFALSNVLGGILISVKQFFWYGIAPALYNMGIIFGILVFVPLFGLYGLALGTILGAALHAAIRLGAVWHAQIYSWKPTLYIDHHIRKTFVLMLPKMFQIATWQILLFWFVRIASELPEGSVTVYSLARNFQSVPVSLIGIAIAMAAFSSLSHIAAAKNYTAFHSLLKKKALLIIVLTSLSAIVLALAGELLIGVLLGGGKFDAQAVHFTGVILAAYCLSIPLESVMHLLARAHYALQNTLRASLIAIGAILLIVVLSGILIESIGLYAIPVSFSVGLGIQSLLLWISYKQLLSKKQKQIS